MQPRTTLLAVLLTIVVAVHAVQTCVCPDFNGTPGVYSGTAGGRAVQCAYPGGACTWDDSGTLLNTQQGNCQRYITPYSCPPKDATGASGTLVNTLVPFACTYNFPDGSEEYCTWNAIGTSLYDEPYCGGITATPCREQS